MEVFKFFEKEDLILELNTGNDCFEIEKEQLLHQGFEEIGDAIKAESSQLAHRQFKAIQSGKKSVFHFFEKDEIILHLVIDSASFDIERDQLIEQGFERVGEPVHAPTNQQAYKKFRKMRHDELHNSSTFLGAATSGGASNFLRFVTEIDSVKRKQNNPP